MADKPEFVEFEHVRLYEEVVIPLRAENRRLRSALWQILEDATEAKRLIEHLLTIHPKED